MRADPEPRDVAPSPMSGRFAIVDELFAPLAVVAGEFVYIKQIAPVTGEEALICVTRETARALGQLLLEYGE